jgi:hypothetical protein
VGDWVGVRVMPEGDSAACLSWGIFRRELSSPELLCRGGRLRGVEWQ